ncbi:MAG: HAMP domain-containing histidine kinase [Coriobacteriaceae bacterium]|nr:HAMP domain-containing histidine kinase [Coriobacteriaceae bacterium]
MNTDTPSDTSTDTLYEHPEDLLQEELPPEVVDFLVNVDIPPEVNDYLDSLVNEMRQREAVQAQFVSDVSHEIRTPLTAIRGTAETLLDGDVPPDMSKRFLEQIIDECDRLTRMANDLLTLQRAEATDMDLTRLNLRTLAENCALLMDSMLEERGVNLEIVGEAPDVNGNSDAINQILFNLIENASRYAGEGGTIRVELAGMQDHSVIAVKDTGPGFGDEVPAHLFDRFYRADQSRSREHKSGNSGLGLAIVKALTTAMGGTVEAANLADGGAVFIVALPSLPAED